MNGRYLIWSFEHRAWWKSGGWGYTTATHKAGTFSLAEATKICDQANIACSPDKPPNEMMIDAPSRDQVMIDLLP